jgi:signal peptidase I
VSAVRAFVLRGLWLVAFPCTLAALTARFFVPTPSEARDTWAEGLASLGDEHTLALVVALIVVFAVLARSWSFWLPLRPSTRPERSDRARTAATLALAFTAALLFRGSFGSYRIESASMLPTLEPEDVVAGTKWAYGLRMPAIGAVTTPRLPARGDIVVFRAPTGVDAPDQLIKRVIGLPGDEIAMHGIRPLINGWQLPACDVGPYLYPIAGGGVGGRLSIEYLADHAYLTIYSPDSEPWRATYRVKPGEVFVLGDNRNNSSDSRAWNGGKGAGVRAESIDAKMDWWLFGERRDQHVDLTHVMHPLDLFVRLDGLDTSAIRAGIERCLHDRPANTTPPPPAHS